MKLIKITAALFVVAIGSITPSMLMAQINDPDFTNNEKYFHLRNRFKERFIKIGECGVGFSIPADHYRIVPNGYGSSGDTLQIKWGDATTFLGHYIASLALEYQLLQNNLQPTDSTLREMYFALSALFRLDASSNNYSYERTQNCNAQDILTWNECLNAQNWQLCDGFTIRDDVSINFVRTQFGVQEVEVQAHVKSSYLGYIYSDNFRCAEKETSQDQCIALLLGLFLTSHYMQGVEFNGVDLGAYARFEGRQILNMIWDDIGGNGEDWEITNPHNNDHHVRTGWGTLGHKPALAVLCMAPEFAHAGCAASIEAASTMWMFMERRHHPFLDKQFAVHMPLTLAALTNLWASPSDGPFFFEQFCAYTDKGYYYLLSKILHPQVNYPDLALTRGYFENMLNQCPCRGPHNNHLDANPAESFGWTTRDRNFTGRWELQPERFAVGPPISISATEFEFVSVGFPPVWLILDWGTETPPIFSIPDMQIEADLFADGGPFKTGEEYPAIDFFNLFNAYTLVYGEPRNYYNLWDANVWREHPYLISQGNNNILVTTEGSFIDPKVYRAYNSISSRAKMRYHANTTNHADVTFIAGDYIELLPGFEVDAGAEFEAYIDPNPIRCDGTNIYRTAAPAPQLTPGVYAVAQQSPSPLPAAASAAAETNETAPAAFLKVLPNPGSERVHIEWASSGGDVRLSLLDAQLREVSLAGLGLIESSGSIELDISSLAAGLYFFRTQQNGAPLAMQKWVKQ